MSIHAPFIWEYPPGLLQLLVANYSGVTYNQWRRVYADRYIHEGLNGVNRLATNGENYN